MKKIILATVDNEPMIEYKKQLNDFFGNLISIEEFSLGKNNEKIDGDLVIILTPTLKNIAYSILKDSSTPILCLQSIFTKGQLERINSISENSNVLVIAFYRAYARECVEILQKLSKVHVNFIPYYAGVREKIFSDVDLGILVGEDIFKPSFISNFMNLGWKKIHYKSLMMIIDRLFKNNIGLREKLEEYKKEIPDIEFSELLEVKLKSEQRIETSGIINAIKDGIIVLDEFDNIIEYNDAVTRYFNIDKDKYENLNVFKVPYLKDIAANLVDIYDNIEVDYYCEQLNKVFKISQMIIRFQFIQFRKIIKVSFNDITNRNVQKNKPKYEFCDILYESSAMKKCVQIAKKISKIDSSVLIIGETGTGKELFANAIHNYSHRKDNPFFAINCTAFQDSLLESELFGYEPGTFTGALKNGKKGIFENANGGTVFLDEIGDAPMSIQVKLLRVLQEMEIRRIGGKESIPIDVRIISATNKNLKSYVDKGLFRKDLFYRLNTYILNIPPLRKRKEDIRLLIMFYLNEFGYKYKHIDEKLVEYMMNLPWDGNIRELRNCVDYLGYMSGRKITANDLPEQYKNIYEDSIDEKLLMSNSKPIFTNISKSEECICEFIIKSLRKENMGRRKIYDLAVQSNIQTTVHQIRRMINLLHENGYLIIRNGRGGCALTNKGIDLYDKIIG